MGAGERGDTCLRYWGNCLRGGGHDAEFGGGFGGGGFKRGKPEDLLGPKERSRIYDWSGRRGVLGGDSSGKVNFSDDVQFTDTDSQSGDTDKERQMKPKKQATDRLLLHTVYQSSMWKELLFWLK